MSLNEKGLLGKDGSLTLLKKGEEKGSLGRGEGISMATVDRETYARLTRQGGRHGRV